MIPRKIFTRQPKYYKFLPKEAQETIEEVRMIILLSGSKKYLFGDRYKLNGEPAIEERKSK